MGFLIANSWKNNYILPVNARSTSKNVMNVFIMRDIIDVSHFIVYDTNIG